MISRVGFIVLASCALPQATAPKRVGPVIVHDAADAERLRGAQIVGGDLVIDAADLATIDLTTIASIEGSFHCQSFAGGELDLPALVSVGGELQIDCHAGSVRAPLLGMLESSGNPDTVQIVLDEPATLDLSALTAITGKLWITTPATGAHTISLPALGETGDVVLQGAMAFSAPRLTTTANLSLGDGSIDLPALFNVQGNLTVGAQGTLSLPSLAMSLDVDASTATQLTTVALPALRTARLISLTNNPALATVDFSSLAKAKQVLVTGAAQTNNALTEFAMPKLAEVENFEIDHFAALRDVSAPALTSASDTLFITTDAQLASVTLDALVDVHNLAIAEDPQLTTIEAPTLATVDMFAIFNDALFPTCTAQQLALQAHAGVTSIYGDAAGCP